MLLTEDWKKTALQVTGHFEDASDPWAAVSGDFDGEGISVGVLQWNIGQGSLQPLVNPIGRAVVVAAMPIYGAALCDACAAPIPQGLEIVRSWQQGQALLPQARAELQLLARTAAFINQQVAAASHVADRAWTMAVDWAQATRNAQPSLREFCWFFDITTQNGGLKTVTPSLTANFITSHSADGAAALVLDWLAARGPNDAGYKDARKNAVLWKGGLGPAKLTLMTASYLRARLARLQFQADMLNRKGTIVMGAGNVHGDHVDLTGLIPATEP
jgi:hypothetical protein